MHLSPEVQPLSYKRRRNTLYILLGLFVTVLPFLYLYATGYRFDFGQMTNLVSTGGIYVAADRTGAEIYIDGELVRETRVFRRAFYAQSLEPGTHRVHVQKENHHTWVKELPVLPHLVTEAAAFNLPVVPQVRIIAPFVSATGSALLTEPLAVHASSTNEYVVATGTPPARFTPNTEYRMLLTHFSTSTATTTDSLAGRVADQLTDFLTATSTTEATTTKEWRGVRLFTSSHDVYARWVGSYEDMPYYYCADDFPPYSTATVQILSQTQKENQAANTVYTPHTVELLHPTQQITNQEACDPIIRMDRRDQTVSFFDFFPGSNDLVVLLLEDGLYLVEIDDRAWQNTQPLLLGYGLDVRIENGEIYVYDGEVIYELLI